MFVQEEPFRISHGDTTNKLIQETLRDGFKCRFCFPFHLSFFSFMLFYYVQVDIDLWSRTFDSCGCRRYSMYFEVNRRVVNPSSYYMGLFVYNYVSAESSDCFAEKINKKDYFLMRRRSIEIVPEISLPPCIKSYQMYVHISWGFIQNL